MASNCTSSGSTHPIPESSSKNKDDFLSEILTCGICLSRMSLPCCLPCAHSFCRSCLLDYAQNNLKTSILCPYCKFPVHFRSLEHFESMLIINPTLKQLCEALETAKHTADQTNNSYRARCHTCCSLQMLKICKHCHFMLCETCRRTHLLDVHRESRMQLDILTSHIRLINDKRLEMDAITQEYDSMRQRMKSYVQKLVRQIEEQRDQALRILDARQHSNDIAFWTGNGFDNGEELDFFASIVETGHKRLSAKNITDKDLMELSDNLQTMPDIDEKTIKSIEFAHLSLELDQTVTTKQFIRIYDSDLPTRETDITEKLTTDSEPTDSSIQT